MKRTWILCGALSFGVGCAAEEGNVLQIRNVPAPEDNCGFIPQATAFYSTGSFDPTGASVFLMPLLIRNNAQVVTNDQAEGFNDRPIRGPVNNVNVVGVDACWFRGDGDNDDFGAFATGEPIDCADVPAAQRGFVGAAANIEEGGGLGIILPEFLDIAALRASGIYGADFDPNGIVPRSGTDTTFADPEDTDRHPAWGAYPFARSSRIFIQVRAQGKLSAGTTVQSNWFTFPVDVVPFAVAGICAEQSTSTCQRIVNHAASCLPYQFGTIVCKGVDGCT